MILLDVTIKLLTILIAVVGGFWALSKFIIERGIVPAAELDIQCTPLGRRGDNPILEFLVIVSNVGGPILVPQGIRIRIKTLGDTKASLYGDKDKRGRLRFTQLLQEQHIMESKDSALPAPKSTEKKRERDEFIELIPPVREDTQEKNNTFVQPGVKQKYTFVTAVEPDVEFVHATVKFNYNVEFQSLARKVLAISKRVGLIQYDLDSIKQPHSVERAFKI